jgi:hypothetical protein
MHNTDQLLHEWCVLNLLSNVNFDAKLKKTPFVIHEILTESQLIAERLILNESYFRNEIKLEHGE